ncbi:MAG: hypothetical protein RL335_812, partial [Bacteroidota bacterium]
TGKQILDYHQISDKLVEAIKKLKESHV